MKSWVLHRVHGLGAAAGRPDLAPAAAEPGLDGADEARARAGLFAEPALDSSEALGAYTPLIRAVRAELERFVASHVCLHVLIADRDRFVLTAVGVRSPGGEPARQLLQQFMREFRPEQVKRYFAREVIGRLPNAAVIDLSQFAGLSDLEARGDTDGDYAELLAALRTAPPPAAAPYEVSILGRWTEAEAPGAAASGGRGAATPATPLAGRRCEVEVDDGAGPRRAVLNAVVPGRRYVIGKGEECDVRVSGTYTSRRHAELWLERGAWFVADAGSTNGIRVEPAVAGAGAAGAGTGAADDRSAGSAGSGRVASAGGAGATPGPLPPLPLGAGDRLVLSARAEGPPADYPRLMLREGAAGRQAALTPVALPLASTAAVLGDRGPVAGPAPSTPRTAVIGGRASEPVFEIAEGERRHRLLASELPITIGRSRGQTLVIDWSHEGVSGRHVEIDRLDDEAAHGIVHGDNGIDIDDGHHATGARFRWPHGRTMILGGALPGEPSCRLTLFRRGGH